MAKTSKTTKRATASSSKKKGFLGRSFNLKSRKVQFVVSILVIAIVGAGYFTFKSFAAEQTWVYSPGANLLYTGKGPGACWSEKGTDSDAQKNSFPVINMLCSSSNPTNDKTVVFTNGAYLSKGMTGTYRFCTHVKGKAAKLEIYVGQVTQNTTSQQAFTSSTGKPYEQSDFYTNINSSSYAYLCSGNFTIRAELGLDGKLFLSGTNGIIVVRDMVLEKVGGLTAPIPVK